MSRREGRADILGFPKDRIQRVKANILGAQAPLPAGFPAVTD